VDQRREGDEEYEGGREDMRVSDEFVEYACRLKRVSIDFSTVVDVHASHGDDCRASGSSHRFNKIHRHCS
jgi:hypothetical protein